MRRALSWGCLALFAAARVRGVELTEDEFLSALDERHAAVQALGDGVARAEAQRRRAGLLANPRLEFWREQPRDNPRLTNWTLAWTPPFDGRRGLARRAGDAGVAAAQAEWSAERAALRREARRAFADWSVGRARCAVLALGLERTRALAEHQRRRASAGLDSGLAARRLALAEAEAGLALREAEAARARAEAEARAWRPALAADVAPLLPVLPAPPARPDAGAAPAVRAFERRHEQARLEERLAGRFWSFPTLQAGVQRLDDGGRTQRGAILAANWSIPLFDRSQPERAEARARATSAAARLSLARALSAAQIEGGLAAYRELFAAAREAQAAAAETERVIEAADAAYRAGESSLTDLLDALRAAFDARLRALDLLASALGAHRDLEAVVGQPLTEGGAR